jgi:hypothetical protein
MITSHTHLMQASKEARLKVEDVKLSWVEARHLAERYAALELELDVLKRNVEQIRILRKGFEDLKESKRATATPPSGMLSVT